ncbi:MAG TPA: acyltransferase [Bacteroidetes bacterium]|nr:acyltransferase [Bacteroidota bacterium]
MTNTPYKKRNLGLDIVRSIAILLVLIEHSHLYFIFGNQPGIWGVEIFFVLSGYLIGQIILRSFSDGVTFGKIKEFWIRRWFRTVPMYFLVLIFLDLFLDPEGGLHWKYYLFLQNLTDHFIFFPVSWSLTIEEWFYLLLPLLFLGISGTKKLQKRATGIMLTGVVLAILLIRIIYVIEFDPVFDLGIRKFPPLRLDALMIGVLLAYVKLHYKHIFQKMASLSVFLFSLVGMVAIALFFYKNSGPGNLLNSSFFARAFIFTCMSLSFALALPWVEQQPFLSKAGNRHPFRFLVTNLSLMTYTVYLVHYDIFSRIVVAPPYSLAWLGQVGLSLLLTFVLSTVLYRFFEKPMTDLRDRFGKRAKKRKMDAS